MRRLLLGLCAVGLCGLDPAWGQSLAKPREAPRAQAGTRNEPVLLLRDSGLRSAHQVRVGVDSVDLTPELRRHYGAPEDHGVLVTRVRGGLGARLGVEVGDVIVAFNGRKIARPGDLNLQAALARASSQVKIDLFRKKKPKTLQGPAGEGDTPLGFPRGIDAQQREDLRRQLQGEIKRLESRLGTLRDRLEKLESPGGEEGSEGGK